MPTLTLSALRARIAKRDLSAVHLLYGEDVKLMDRIVDAIEATVDPADRPFAVERMYAAEDGGWPIDIVAAASTRPMLGDRRIVTVLRAERLLKPKRAAKATADSEPEGDQVGEDEALDLAPLEDYVASPAEWTALILVATEIDKTRRLTKRLLASSALVTQFGATAEGEPEGPGSWLRKEAELAGRALDNDAARMLVARAGGDITKLRGDLERLLLFTEGRSRISIADVREVVSEDIAPDDWAVVNAIADGDPARALAETGRRLDRGDSPHQLVGQLRWWVSTRLAEGEPGRVRAALEVLLRTDLALKSSGGEDRVLLERLVVELIGKPLPRQNWGGRR